MRRALAAASPVVPQTSGFGLVGPTIPAVEPVPSAPELVPPITNPIPIDGTGKTEIAKIYAALDYNVEKGIYGPNQKPIKWVKVHALPDHVFFKYCPELLTGGKTAAGVPVFDPSTAQSFVSETTFERG